uniref:Uncharacterized protein n=1 Tax=Arundo donax TaxID=35708 RepID=A0A0A9C2K0_ARUDO
MANRLHESDQLPFVGCELGVVWRDGATEEGYGPGTLM